jgi:putative transcriptional regulator
VCAHSDEGALGLIINRPTEVEAGEAVPELAGLLGADARLWAGGPVQPSSIVLLAELEDPPEDTVIVTGDVALILQGADLDDLEDTTRRARAFLGYAGWGPGQLEGELETEDWIVAPAAPEDAFADDGDALWGAVLARKGGEYALLATMPPDPSVN